VFLRAHETGSRLFRNEDFMTVSAPLLAGKRGLIMGVANERSIAWGIAKAAHAQGAKLAFTYQGQALMKRLGPLAETLHSNIVLPCDVSVDSEIDKAFETLGEIWGGLDFVVHAIAFSDKDQLKGRYVDTTAENFSSTMHISCYSFTAVCQRAHRLMKNGGSLLTLSYLGAERVTPHYNVMGVAKAALEASVRYLAEDLGRLNIRVNGLSAGPMKTLAASGIGDFRYILRWNQLNSPLRRNVSPEDVGGAAVYLLSELSSAVTGEIHHVDCGYHVVGMMAPDAAEAIRDLLENYSVQH
jgi:enoyl-[acyl-carrier protein] reductase I